MWWISGLTPIFTDGTDQKQATDFDTSYDLDLPFRDDFKEKSPEEVGAFLLYFYFSGLR